MIGAIEHRHAPGTKVTAGGLRKGGRGGAEEEWKGGGGGRGSGRSGGRKGAVTIGKEQ